MSLGRRVLPLAGLLASLMLVWSATAGILWNANTPAALQDARFSAAERVIFYRVGGGGTLRMSLPAGVQSLRLSTHLELPQGTRYGADRQYVYGFVVRFVGEDGNTVVERPLFTRTRQSKGDPVGEAFRREAAFTTTMDVQLADQREFIITPPAELGGAPGHLEIDFTGEGGALLVRAYAQSESGRPPLLASRRRALVERAESKIGRATFLPWEKLPWGTQRRLMSEQWERVDAVGEPGRDFETLAVYRTDFRLPLVEVAEERQERLWGNGAAAVNVVGPARLVLWVWSPEKTAGAAGPVTATLLSEHGVKTSVEVPVSGDAPSREFIDVPAGAHTLSVTNGGAADLRYTVEGPRFAWLAPEELKATTRAAQLALVPDVRRYDAWVTGPSCEPLVLEVSPSLNAAGRLLRIDARTLEPGAPGEVKVELLGDADAPLSSTSFPVSAEPAVYDAAELPFGKTGALPCVGEAGAKVAATPGVFEVTDRPARVSAPTSARLFLLPGTRRVRIHAAQATAVSLTSFLSPKSGAQQEAPYADHALVGVRWRHAPWTPGYWHPLRPHNHLALARAGAAVQIRTQVRLEPQNDEGAPPPSGTPVTLSPLGTPGTRELLEEDIPDPGARRMGRGLYTRLVPNEPVRLMFDARTSSRPELRLDVDDPSSLGKDATLIVDGTPLRRFRLRTSRDRALLPPVKPGLHDVVLETSAPGVQALVNRAPAPGQPVNALRTRKVYRANEGLRVRVPKRGRDAVTLNIVVYGQSPQAIASPTLRVRIDGGTPRRTTGMLVPGLTRADRTLMLPPTDRAPAEVVGEAGSRWYARTLFVRLGEDLAPGTHEVRIDVLDGQPLWARFFIYGQKDGDVSVRQWNRQGWEDDTP